jgi:lipoprotein-anchoring transpeptidase ErfK/SrfK
MDYVRRMIRHVAVVLGVVVIAFAIPATTASAAMPAPRPSPAIGAPVAAVEPAAGSTVGVGQPIIVTYTAPVADRAAAERSIRITSPATATGTYRWMSDDVVQWIPDALWPAHSEVKLSVGGMPLTFDIGTSVVGVASISNHTFTVSIDGVVARTMPASMGKPRHPTPVGSFSVLAKERRVVMDSRTIGIPLSDPEGYKLTVDYAVRVTWGGVYVHSAPWSVGSQGYANVSHGCINLSPDNAAWYYNQVGIGDAVIINS